MIVEREKIKGLILSNYPKFVAFGISLFDREIRTKDRRVLAEDVVQEAIVRVLKYFNNGGCEPDNFVQFVHTTMKNIHLNSFKKKSEELLKEGTEEKIPQQETSFSTEDMITMERCLNELDERSREILLMNLYKGITTKQISETIKKPQGSILRWLNQARIAFKNCYETHG